LSSGSRPPSAAPDSTPPIRQLASRPRNLVLLFVLGVLLVVGISLLFGKVAGYAETLDQLGSAEPVWLAVCFGSQVLSYAAYVTLVRALATYCGGPTIDKWLATRVVFASLGATRLLGAAGAGGLAVLFWAYRQLGFDRNDAFLRVLMLNVLLYACFGAAALVAGVVGLVALAHAPVSMKLGWIAGSGVCFAAAYYVTAPGRAARLTATENAGRVRRLLAEPVEAVVLVRQLASDRRANRATLVAAPLYWLGDMACLWAALQAFGVSLRPSDLVLAYATGFLANLIPLPTGGIGGVDAATTFALVSVGVPLQSALLGVFAYRFFSFLLPTLPAIGALVGIHKMGDDLRELAPTAATASGGAR
jgi:uncharacterized membrane protein YbhN (UPF0104 family)